MGEILKARVVNTRQRLHLLGESQEAEEAFVKNLSMFKGVRELRSFSHAIVDLPHPDAAERRSLIDGSSTFSHVLVSYGTAVLVPPRYGLRQWLQ
jgi:hypothetical protein